MKVTITFLAINLFSLPLTFAQIKCDTCATIKGIVLDEKTIEPLIGANVILLNTNRGAATDINGFFIINNIPLGTYSVRASYIGYSSQIKDSVVLKSHDTLSITFELVTGWGGDAREDIRNGIVRILIGGLPVFCASFDEVNELCSEYGFEYELMGCMFFGREKYNEQVYNYLDSLNGVGWREQFDKDMDELCNKNKF